MQKVYQFMTMILFFWGSNFAFAAPEIQSVLITDNSIDIIGTEFGIKTPAAPLLWEDFENGINGETITVSPNWVKYPGGENGGRYSNLQSYSGDLAAYNYIAPDGEFNTSNFFFKPSEQIYYSYVLRWTSTNVQSGSSTVLKYGRINAPPNLYNGAGNFAFSSGRATTGGGSYFFVESGAGGYLFQDYATASKDSWHRVEMYSKLSSPAGSANGINWYSLDGNIKNRTGLINRAAGLTFQHDNIILGLMCANVVSPETVSMWVDDVYVDNTRARVELGDSSNWNDCIKKDIQIPTAWETNQISIKINTGQFVTGTTLYLYVVDADGNVNSSGYPLIKTSTGLEIAPSTPAPKNLRVAE